MNILVEEISSTYAKEKEMKSKEVICPKCNENILLNLKEYKINLYDCKNKHNINNILFEEFIKTQKIKIICNICKNKNKSNTFNKEFFKWLNCNINICPLCKSTHNEIHHIINYDFKSIICSKHKDKYLEYCHNCKEDLCIIYEKEHNNHNITSYEDLIPNKDEMIKQQNIFKEKIDKFKNIINELINK